MLLNTITYHFHRLAVKAKAKIRQKSILVEEGYNVSIDCSTEGNPSPVITWYKVGGKLSDNTHVNNKETLMIEIVRRENEGQYACRAINYLNNSTASVNVIVKKRLSWFVKSSDEIRTFLSRMVKIYCMYENGVGPFMMTWYKNKKKLRNREMLSRGNQVLIIRSVKRENFGEYKCVVQSKFSTLQTTTKIAKVQPETCQDIRSNSEDKSGQYTIYLPNVSPIQVYCDMKSKNGRGVTIISHDSEAKTLVNGYDPPGSYVRKIKYSVSKEHLKELVKVSSKCEQFIKYECKNSVISDHGCWVSLEGKKMKNWGGVDHTTKGCACKLTGSCAGNRLCNCDRNDLNWREDSGLLQEKEYLPVSEVRFGDTGSSEYGYHTVGKLKCY